MVYTQKTVKPILGIIGGNGVAATNKLLQLIEEFVTKNGACRDAHHPEIIAWHATQAPSRSMFLEGRGESFIPHYVEIGKKLKASGATILCMCCNTAHFAVKELEEQIGLPFISLIEETILVVKQNNYKRIGLLASDGCVSHNLYSIKLEKHYPTAQIIYPDSNFQKKVTQGICNIKNKNRFVHVADKNKPSNLFSEVIQHLNEQDCDCIILGCTDISVDFNTDTLTNIGISIPIIDSLQILSQSIIKQVDYESNL